MVKISNNRLDMETKRIDRPQLKYYSETLSTVAAAAVTTLDLANGNVIKLTHGANIFFLDFSNVPQSGTYAMITIIRVKDNSATTRSVKWPLSFSWAGDTAPTFTQQANAVDVVTAVTIDGGESWQGFPTARNLS